MQSKTIPMSAGEMNVMDHGDVRVHVYDTNDLMDDQVILLENTATREAVVLECPPFRENMEALGKYIEENGIRPVARLLSYHAAGTSFLTDVTVYMTSAAKAYNTEGPGAGMVTGFAQAFGPGFDGTIIRPDRDLSVGEVEIAGIRMVINGNDEAYEVEVPSIRTVYVHMIGHDKHSIVPAVPVADFMIGSLTGYLDKGYECFLSSHHVPETREDVQEKIAYLNVVKEVIASSANAEEFKAALSSRYPGYGGANYLDMSAGALYPQ